MKFSEKFNLLHHQIDTQRHGHFATRLPNIRSFIGSPSVAASFFFIVRVSLPSFQTRADLMSYFQWNE